MKIIITRPEPFASQLAEKLKMAGFANVVCLPCVNIEPVKIPPTSSTPFYKGGNMIIFISRNAVIHGHHFITTEKIAAIGLGTKSELEQHQHCVDIFPNQAPFNSEALLALPEFLNVQHKKISIIRGGEGRDLLFDTLTARGALVSYIDVYTRKQPNYTDEILQQVFNDPDHSLVICTSEELLKNLCMLLKKAKIELSRLQLCVISAKMSEYARTAGFTKQAIIAGNPMDEDMIKWIMQSQKNQNINAK